MTATTRTDIAAFLTAQLDEDVRDFMEDVHPYCMRVNDPEGRYWWECPWCFKAGGHVEMSSAAVEAALEHGLSECPSQPRVLAQVAALRAVADRYEQVVRFLDNLDTQDSSTLNAQQAASVARHRLELCGERDGLLRTLRAIASIWADADGWQGDWR